MQRIIPNIWCQSTAADAAARYAAVLPNADWRVTARYPESGLPALQQHLAGRELIVDVTVDGYVLRLINAGDEFRPNPSLSFLLTVDPRRFGGDTAARGEIDRMWSALSDGGVVRMELDDYPHSPHYGWVEDRFGVNWQLLQAVPEGEEQPLITPHLMFTGARPRARDAVETYTALFDDGAVGSLFPFPEGGPGGDDGDSGQAVMFGDFTMAGQRFSVADGGDDHDFDFTPGVSLQVDCADQAEIDRLWNALSAVPEAEQCGWLVDRFGVSWQIVPAMMDELMARPGAYTTMLGMKRLVIADF